MISWIAIRNYRSIDSVDIDCNWITTFAGKNDAGKSNILRSLNLFFNDETDPNTPLLFNRDFNSYAKVGKNKARQISITLRFVLPHGYQREGYPNQVEWRKVWRERGSVPELSFRRYVGGEDFPSRSKIPSLLDRIRFTYVPAIKDKFFFADLQGQLYDALASAASTPLKESASDFEGQIQQQLGELVSSIRSTFQTDSKLHLPDNLRAIFESLEISTDGIPLSRRGDGIKIRHIPMILKFIADKHDALLTQGGIRHTHIWGFEEPENNVEMLACFDMAGQLLDIISNSNGHQLFLTTHSPVFYDLEDPGEKETDDVPWINRYFVQKFTNSSKVVSRSIADIDESLGLMTVVAPYITRARDEYNTHVRALKEAKRIAEKNMPTIFVEGESDRIALQRAINLFHAEPFRRVHIEAGGVSGYGSASALASRSLAWLLEMRHRAKKDRTPAVAVFDADQAGKKSRNELLDNMKNMGLDQTELKVLTLETPPRLRDLVSQNFSIAIDLESYYTDAVWKHAEEQGWIKEDRKSLGGLSPKLLREFLDKKVDPRVRLSRRDQRRLKYHFTTRGKLKAAKYIQQLSDEDARNVLAQFEPLTSTIVEHIS